MKRSKFWTFLFSFCPGAGQMYQGYMKRGLTLITLFILPIVVGAAFIPVLGLASLVVYMYSFFDSFNLKAQLESGDAPEDDFLISFNFLHDDMKTLIASKGHFLGWGCVVIGVVGLYKTVFENILLSLIQLIPSTPIANGLRQLLYSLPGIFVGILFICVGLWLVKGGNKKKENEDFEVYTGDEHES